MDSQYPTRRSAIKAIGASALAVGSAGQVSAQKRGRGGKGVKKRLKRLTRKHGRPSITDLSVVDRGTEVTRQDAHAEAIDEVRSRGYNSIQIESIEFEDGHTTMLLSGRDGRDVFESMGTNRRQFRITDSMLSDADAALETTAQELDRNTSSSESGATTAGVSTASTQFLSKGESLSIGTASGGSDRIVGSNPLTAPAGATHRTGSNLVGAAVQTRYLAYKAGGVARVFQDVYMEDSGTIEMEFNGTIDGIVTAIIASATVELDGFIREKGTSDGKKFSLMDISGALQARGVEQNYSPDSPGPGGENGKLFKDVSPGTYEIGIRLKISSTAFSTSSAVINFYPNYSTFDFFNFCDYSFISTSYV